MGKWKCKKGKDRLWYVIRNNKSPYRSNSHERAEKIMDALRSFESRLGEIIKVGGKDGALVAYSLFWIVMEESGLSEKTPSPSQTPEKPPTLPSESVSPPIFPPPEFPPAGKQEEKTNGAD